MLTELNYFNLLFIIIVAFVLPSKTMLVRSFFKRFCECTSPKPKMSKLFVLTSLFFTMVQVMLLLVAIFNAIKVTLAF